MKHGARNDIRAKVTELKTGDIMSQVRFSVTDPIEMTSVLTTESLEEMGLKPGDTVRLVIKAVHVLPMKD